MSFGGSRRLSALGIASRVAADAAHRPDIAAHFHEIKPVPRQFAESDHVAETNRRPCAGLRVLDFVLVLRIVMLHGISILLGWPERCFPGLATLTTKWC